MNVYCPTIFNISMDPHVTNGPKHLFEMFKAARSLLKTASSRMDKKCQLCLKSFPLTSQMKSHITKVHKDVKNEWELWLKGFFANNWFAHIGKKNIWKPN